MRYHIEPPDFSQLGFGEKYICDHPVYSECTLFKIGDHGLAVIQQRFDPIDKSTRWGAVDPWITSKLYLNEGFKKIFNERCGPCVDGLYPTISVRQIMWALRIKPLKRERWETVFDRKDI